MYFKLQCLQDHYGVLAQHYQLPQLSIRNAMYHEVLAGTPGFSTREIYPDVEQEMQRHPSELGHRYMADVAGGAHVIVMLCNNYGMLVNYGMLLLCYATTMACYCYIM
jgi:hypothetical protein